jgi:hypothetical protein
MADDLSITYAFSSLSPALHSIELNPDSSGPQFFLINVHGEGIYVSSLLEGGV